MLWWVYLYMYLNCSTWYTCMYIWYCIFIDNVSWKGLPTHTLVHFGVDNTVCGLPLKRILDPSLPELIVGCTCRVKWRGKKQYDGTVLFMGKRLLWNGTYWQLLYWLSHCLSGSKSSVAKEELDWAASHGHDSFSTEAVEDMTSDESSHQTETKGKCSRQRKRKNQKEVHVWYLAVEC